jgi:glycolate oxidase FAD binding subunit
MRKMTAATVEDVQAIVQSSAQVQAQGAATKPALALVSDTITQLNMQALAGIQEYEPGEYTFTALAGTPLCDVVAALAVHNQFMPFDPPLVDAGATLGGTVAAGLSGSGRYRYGGVRDFLIGVRFVDGQGRLVRGGGKVVKNAAGFDLPKLMVGSLGRFGILTEVSFKVFPQPPAYATLKVPYPDLPSALAGLQRLVEAHFDLYALDLLVGEPPTTTYVLLVRLGGAPGLLRQRIGQVRTLIGAAAAAGEMVVDEADAQVWTTAREFRWAPPEAALVKVATTVDKIAQLETRLAPHALHRRYSCGGNLLWLAWSTSLQTADELLLQEGVSGLVVRGDHTEPLIGVRQGQAFTQRIKQALDPQRRFPAF